MKQCFWGLVLTLLMVAVVRADEHYVASVAQVRVTAYSVSIDHPWQKGSAGKSYGSAVFIDDDRLLTNAHVIDAALRVELRRAGSDRWYRASIEHVSEASDLALLTVADEEFYRGAKPAKLARQINFGTSVKVVGFPEGGDTVSVTKGVLSRTEETQYTYSLMNQLAYQIDAAINNGNSGGAVFAGEKLMGISFQAYDDAENLGYAIPVSVIEQFIGDAKDGAIDGVPQLPFIASDIANSNLREYFGLNDRSGVYISETVGDQHARCAEKGDVLTALNGLSVSPTGRVDLPGQGLVSIDSLAGSRQVGDSVELAIISQGKHKTVTCQLIYNWKNVWSTAGIDYQYRPNWIEVGGLVLVDMSEEVFMYLDDNKIVLDADTNVFRYGLQRGSIDNPTGGILVSNVLDHDANVGYDVIHGLLKKVNGKTVGNVKGVSTLIDENTSPWLILEFDTGTLVVFKQSELAQISDDLAQEYGI